MRKIKEEEIERWKIEKRIWERGIKKGGINEKKIKRRNGRKIKKDDEKV